MASITGGRGCYNPGVRIILVPAVLLVLAAQAQHAMQLGPRRQQMQAAQILWDTAAPKADTLVKVAVPPEIARELLKPGTGWRLMAGDALVTAMMDGMVSGRQYETSLKIAQESAKQASDLTVVLDRGNMPRKINELAFKFSQGQVLSKVSVEASNDSIAYKQIGAPQVVFQGQVNDKLVRLTDIALEPGSYRYLRVTFSGLAGTELTEVIGRYNQASSADDQVAVEFGPVLADGNGNRIWPLKFKALHDPITRLELTGQAPGQVLELDIVKLDAQGKPVETVSSAFWVDRLLAGGVERNEHSIAVPVLDPALRYGIRINGHQDAMFTGLSAYRCSLALVFNMPSAANLRLEIFPGNNGSTARGEFDAQHAKPVGVVGPLTSKAMPVEMAASPEHNADTASEWEAAIHKWWRMTAYLLGALCLCLAGSALLRRRRVEEP